MSRIRERITYANVMATIAVFIALGTGAYAASTLDKNEVKSKHIKAGAVKNADLGDNAVTAPKVANGSLLGEDFAAGQLPAGARGEPGPQGPAGSPDTPAQVLDKIKQVDGTGSGLDADTLAGAAAASFKDGCPSDMNNVLNVVCLDKVPRGTSTWFSAIDDCADRNRRLPSLAEIYLAQTEGRLSDTLHWSDAIDGAVGSGVTEAIAITGDTGNPNVLSSSNAGVNHYCAVPPTDG